MSLFDNNITMRTMNLLEKGLDVSMLRREVLANNIANVDVPNFKRSEVSFESNLKRAIDLEQVLKETPPLRTNNPLHISRREMPPKLSKIAPQVHLDYNSTMRNDGNNVDMEDEVTKIVRNQMQYSLMVDRIGGEFRMLNSMMRLA